MPEAKKAVVPMRERNKALKEHNAKLLRDSVEIVTRLRRQEGERKQRIKEREERLKQ